LREKPLNWADSLEQCSIEGDLNDVSSLCAEECKLVSWVNDAASEDSLDCTHVNVLKLYLLVDQVSSPDSQAVVVDGEEL
jgi:hypothetical protein